MKDYVVAPQPRPIALVEGGGFFPVRRIFCIGKNYSDHVREMGGDSATNKPVFFTKPADAIVISGPKIPYPQGTSDLHFEGELVVALKEGGINIKSKDEAVAKIFGFAAGCDLTRRDLQAVAKNSGGPWDTAKAFDHSAPMSAILPMDVGAIPTLEDSWLRTTVNDDVRQEARLSDMIRPIDQIIMALSGLFELQAGDLIFTGTPAGVGALRPGDWVKVSIESLPILEFSID